MYTETVIAKYTLIFSVLVEIVEILEVALGVLGISKRVGGGVAAERIPL